MLRSLVGSEMCIRDRLSVSDYEPGSEYIYYWGSGWSKYGFEADTDWNKYLEEYAQKVRNPLVVHVP